MKTPPTKYQRRWISTYSEYEWVDDKLVLVKEEGYWYQGPMALAHQPVNLIQDAFRWYDSTGTQVTAQDTDPTSLDVDTAYQFCVRIENSSNDSSSNNNNFRIEYLHPNGGNAWTQVGVSDGTGTPVITATAGLTDGATYGTDRLTGPTGTRVNGYEETSSDTDALTIGTNSYLEIVYGIQIDSTQVTNGDTIDIRITSAGTVL
ncbi:MAG: hypothetical protein JSW51_07340, partial [Gemmatimonadota bacterium]